MQHAKVIPVTQIINKITCNGINDIFKRLGRHNLKGIDWLKLGVLYGFPIALILKISL